MTEHDRELAELRHQIDRIHRITPGAADAPAGLWSQVLAQSTTTPKESSTMSSITAPTQIGASQTIEPRKSFGRVGHYVNLVACITLVALVAIGGWFTAMQISAPGRPEPRFAVLGIQPEAAGNGVCDVEPMTVDEVMAIVENPYSYSYDPERASKNLLSGSMKVIEMDYYEAWMYRIDDELLSSGRTQVTVQDFDAASDRMNGWLSCAFDGTAGQALSFVDPFDIQRLVLSNFPVYRDVATVRESVGSLLEMPASNLWGTYRSAFSAEGLTVKANPVREDASQLDDEQALRYNSARILQIGVRVTDEEGETVFENSFSGVRTVDSSIPLKDGFTVLMAKSAFNGEWYVLAFLPDRT